MDEQMKIAIIDDEKDMRESISQWVSLSGHKTKTYSKAVDALSDIGRITKVLL